MTNEDNSVIRKSGYDPATQICWDFRNKGDRTWRCKCPAHIANSPERDLFYFGRCRSGQRWFWQAHCLEWGEAPPRKKFGWADSEELATAAAIAAVLELRKPELLVLADFNQGTASRRLKELNEKKRRQRPAPDTSDSHAVEYLYGSWYDGEDCVHCLYRFRITRKTRKRIFYIRPGEAIDEAGESKQRTMSLDRERVGFVDRQKLEADGEADNRGVHWSNADSHLHISLQHLLAHLNRYRYREPDPEKPDVFTLLRLKAEIQTTKSIN
jgi:hypothetical protein